MTKCLRHILMLVVFTALGLSGWGQFDPTAIDANDPTVAGNANAPVVGDVCTSCTLTPVIETFQVLAFDEGTAGFLDNCKFEWVVFGGQIISNNGFASSTSSNTINDGSYSYTREYFQITGTGGDNFSQIQVQMDEHLPLTGAWVAVRQTSEFGCTDGNWSVFQMTVDQTDPEIQFGLPYASNPWITSLVAITDGSDFSLTMNSFPDDVISSVSPVAPSTPGNVDPIPYDACAINTTTSNILATGGYWDGNYAVGDHTLASVVYDCQGNDSSFTQVLHIYNSNDFSLTAPTDYTFPNNSCNLVNDVDFPVDASSLGITVPAGWSPLDTTIEVIGAENYSGSGCVYYRTRAYTVTLVHSNNHNTYDITANRTYYYIVDGSGPTLTTQDINVNLDATGNASITPADIVYRLFDNCISDTSNIIVNTFSPSSFTGANVGTNTVTLEVQDSCGNVTSQTATVTILDNTPPVVDFCPGDSIVNIATNSCDSTLTPFVPLFSDTGDGIDSVYWSMSDAVSDAADRSAAQMYIGSYTFPVGTTDIVYTVKDASGNSNTCSFSVTVNDNQLPTAVWPSDISNIAWEEALAGYQITIPTLSDNCSPYTYTLSLNGVEIESDLITSIMGNDYTLPALDTAANNIIRFSFSDVAGNSDYHDMIIHADGKPRIFEVSHKDPNCNADNNGEIQLNWTIAYEKNVAIDYTDAAGGVGAYTTLAGRSLLGLFAGTYYFRVHTLIDADGSGYTSYSDTLAITLTDPPAINLSFPEDAVTPETCDDLNNGALTVVVDYVDLSGTPNPFRNYSVSWTMDENPFPVTAPDTLIFGGLDSSVYVLTVTDVLGCMATETYTVTIDNGYIPTITRTGAYSDGLVNGQVILQADAMLCERTIVAGDLLDPSYEDLGCDVGLTIVNDYTSTSTLAGAVFPVDTTNVTWTVTDATGNVVEQTYSIIVQDLVPPGITVASDATMPYCNDQIPIPLPTVDDYCGIDSVTCNLTGNTNWWPNIFAGETETNNITFDISTTTEVIWTVKDVNGNSDFDSYNIDFTQPLDTTTGFFIVNAQCADYTNGVIHIEFDGGRSPYDITIGSVYSDLGNTTKVFEVTDVVPSDYKIIIADADGCQIPIDAAVVDPNQLTATLVTQTNNNCFEDTNGALDLTISGGNPSYTFNWSGPTYNYTNNHPWHTAPAFTFADSEDQSSMPTGNYVLTVTDSRGCQILKTYDILSLDNTAPTYDLSTTYNINTSTDGGYDCTFTFSDNTYDPAITADNCSDYIAWHNLRPLVNSDSTTLNGYTLNVGTTSVIWKVYDRSGNGSQKTVSYIVTDDQQPSFDTPPPTLNVYVGEFECNYTLQASNYDMVYSDNCGVPTRTYRRSDNSLAALTDPFEVRTEPDTITWTLTDAAGLKKEYKQLIKVNDTIRPKIDCSSPINVYLKSNPSNPNYVLSVPDYEDLITDNCTQFDTIYANRNDIAGRTFGCADVASSPISVKITAVDIWGNRDSCDIDVNVLDTIKPIASTTAKTIYFSPASPSSVTLTPSILNNGSYDNCTPAGSLTYTLLHNGQVQNDSTFDCSAAGIVHPVTLRISDASGNTTLKVVNVTVQDTIAPIVTEFVSPPIRYLNSSGKYTVNGKAIVDTIIDNCSTFAELEVSSNPAVLICDSVGITSILLTTDDKYGNSRTTRVSVDVRDTIKPTAVLTDITVRLGTNAAADTTLADNIFDNGSFDNCGNVNFSLSQNYFDCNDVGTTKIYVTVDDGHGNSVLDSVNLTILTPVTINDIVLNACNSTAFFSGDVTPLIADPSEYEWSWWISDKTNQGQPNDNIFCDDVDLSLCNEISDLPEPYYDPPNNNSYHVNLQVRPVGSVCWSASKYIDLAATQGQASTNEISDSVDICVTETEIYTVQDLVGASSLTWSFVGTDGIGQIINEWNDLSGGVAMAEVQWDNTTITYDQNNYLKLVVGYDTGGGSNGKKACNDIYTWYPWVHDAPTPLFNGVIETEACPNDTVTYELTQSYASYIWKGITAGQFIDGGDNASNFVTVVWNGTLGASDSIKVTVYNSNYCYDSVWTSPITITDNDPPTFTSTASDFDRIMSNQTGRCDTILSGLPFPAIEDICNGNACTSCEGLIRTYEIRNSTTSALLFSGDSTNFRARRLPVGTWDIEWFAEDAGGNTNAIPFTYQITVNDVSFPEFTTTPTSFFHDSDLSACTHTHDNAEENWDLTATDYCGVDTIWCEIGSDATHRSTVDGFEFTNSITTVTWHVIDVNSNETTHSYNVILNDVNYPTFTFGAVPADAGVFGDPGAVNYEGVLADNQRMYIFENAASDSFTVSIPAVITDFCSMGPVTVTLTDPSGTVRGPFTVTPSGSNYTFTRNVALGRTIVRWDYEDASGNSLSKQHRVVYASTKDFQCTAPAAMWANPGDHVCNPEVSDFEQGAATANLPAWFSTLRSLNILNYTLSFDTTLQAPVNTSGCLYLMDKIFNGVYKINIVGNSTSQLEPLVECQQSFQFYIDNDGPIIDESNKGNLTLECGDPDQATKIAAWLADTAYVQTADITDDCTSSAYIEMTNNYTALAGSTCGPGSTTTVTFTLLDSCGNSSTFTADIIFDDTTKPYFTDGSGTPLAPGDMPQDLLIADGNAVSCANIPYPVPTINAGDDCDTGIGAVVYTQVSTRNADGIGGTKDDNQYTNTRTWTATDACGNDTTWTQIIQVDDKNPPTFIEDVNALAPTPLTVSCASVPTAPTFTYTDDCDLSVYYNYKSVSTQAGTQADASYYNYTITRTWRIADNVNDTVSHVQVITVQDITAPTISTQASGQTVQCSGASIPASFNTWLNTNKGGALATDNCATQSYLTWTNDYDISNWVNICGNSDSVQVTFTVTDPTGNSATTSAVFKIIDTTIPAISDSLTAIGPYGSASLVPTAYTTIAELKAVPQYAAINFTDNCETDQNNLTIVLETETSTIASSSCTYTIRRFYYVVDPCGNRSKTFTQRISVNDGVVPTFIKAYEEDIECALVPLNQQTLLTGLALDSTDVTDNCIPSGYYSAGAWLVNATNVAAGSIKYRVYNNGVEETAGWTTGNLDTYTFNEGFNDVWYQLTDANGNKAIKQIYRIQVLERPVIASNISGTASIGYGGDNNPLKGSKHTYTITMHNYTTHWGVGDTGWSIYDESADDDFIAGNNGETPYVAGTDYSIVVNHLTGDNVEAVITFNGNLAEGGNYILVFTERNTDNCFDQRSYPFTLEAPFDVDVAAEIDMCPDESGNINSAGANLTTSSVYTVTLNNASYPYGWSFDYEITGNTAAISNVSATNYATHDNEGGTNSTGSITVSGGTYTVQITVDYLYSNGAQQNITISLDNISGQFNETDADATNTDAHVIYVLPTPGEVSGVE